MSKWWSRRSLRIHGALVVLLPGFAIAFWWQLHRALGGNELSWAYTVEWPIFAAYAVFMWWRLLHDDNEPRPWRSRRGRDRSAEEEAERIAYNAYLATLSGPRPAAPNPDPSAGLESGDEPGRVLGADAQLTEADRKAHHERP